MLPLLWLIPGAVCLVAAGFQLRANNAEAVRLRDVVLQADKDNGDVETALQDLRAYMGQHMNTGLANGANAVHPPIQLKYTYDRLMAGRKGSGNQNVYSDAQGYCETNGSQGFSGKNRLQCIQTYVSQHGGAPAEAIPKNLYQFDFASPLWSPDKAGWLLVAAGLFVLAVPIHFIARMIRALRRGPRR